VVFALAGCGIGDGIVDDETSVLVSAQSAEVATAWFALQLPLVRDTPGFTPPVASRAFAYSGVALYEAVVSGMDGYRSLVGAVHDLSSVPQPVEGAVYFWPAAANAALASITRELYATTTPQHLAEIDALEAKLRTTYAATVAPDVLERSAAYGEDVAAAIFEWSRGDGGDEGYAHNFPTSYVPPTGPGLWVPTPPGFLPAMQPFWGTNRTFALADAGACPIDAPLELCTVPGSEFATEANEVYETSLHLTTEQTAIARFWDDSMMTATPPGHWISIVTEVLERDHATLDVAAEAYAKVGIAVADAFIATWATKYQYNLLRPVTYVRAEIDAAWTPLLVTPPFPEYPSGHSVQSAAAAQVLTDMLGVVAFTDHTHDERGLPARSFDSFAAAADEAARSRLYGGIHFRAAIERGLDMGSCIGASASRLPVRR
jgi:hypothetical protein